MMVILKTRTLYLTSTDHVNFERTLKQQHQMSTLRGHWHSNIRCPNLVKGTLQLSMCTMCTNLPTVLSLHLEKMKN